MEKIYLNILGFKNFESEKLEELLKELEKIKIDYNFILYKPLQELKRKVRYELDKRETSKQVWVKFTCSWSGYSNNPSAPRRELGTAYRKIDREIAKKLPSYFCHRFSDGSTNDWCIEIVSVKGKEKKTTYSHQVDEFLKTYEKAQNHN